MKVQHASRPAAARAAHAVASQHPLGFEEVECLMQNGLGEPQLGVLLRQALQKAGGIAVVFEQAIQHPADRQLEIEKARWGLTEIVLNIRQTHPGRLAAAVHSVNASRFCLMQSRFDFQALVKKSMLLPC